MHEDDTVTIELRGKAQTIPLGHAIELARALNAAVAQHVNQRKLTVHDGGVLGGDAPEHA